jgi:signal transduction histidine kinase
MNRRRARAWTLFAATAVPLLGVLAWLTVTLVQLEHDERCARQEAELHERVRLALWRMDSWLSPQIVREAMRPAGDYRSFAPATAAWTKGYSKLAPDEVLVPSPLLGFESELLLLHFELLPDGTVRSPQVPLGNERDVAESNGVDAAVVRAAEQRLATLRPHLTVGAFAAELGTAEAQLAVIACHPIPPGGGVLEKQVLQSKNEYSNRQGNVVDNIAQQRAATFNSLLDAPVNATEEIGPMVPFWIDGDSLLVLGRRVRDASGSRFQGVLLGWPALQRDLCALVADLFEASCVRLRRCALADETVQGTMLAAVPARLEASVPMSALASVGLPITMILGVTWGVTLLGLAVLGFTLRAAIGFGERRARFASAVTHELRTPLTTFRMYSEMLAEGVVREPQAQREYLATLQRESDRLARVVENVLVWSRLEEGRFASRRERHAIAPLVDRLAPLLQRRLEDAGMRLSIDIADAARDAVLSTDEDAVGQILFNLVDNAAKYGTGGDGVVDLRVAVADGLVRFEVSDHGPGIAPSFRRAVFAPFDRGAIATGSNDVPGVGLGLPLARGLARDLGGDLELAEHGDSGRGARFVLSLPRAGA